MLFLGGYTSRSQSYAQALSSAGLHPEHVLLFGLEGGSLPGQGQAKAFTDGMKDLFIPDFSEPLEETVSRWRCSVDKICEQSINSVLIYECIKKIGPRMIIYSGYGGQIVGSKLLGIGIPFLHMHSGWLPDYKGSTTLYYSWLKEDYCAVSAIILAEKIDAGPIVAKRRYPPPKGIDPDYIYDNAIRADLLVSVLKDYSASGRFVNPELQTNKGTNYYVIHPVLKHLARLQGN